MTLARAATGTLAEQIATLRPGDHLCLVYETPREQIAAVVPFVRDGLASGEFCAYIADQPTFDGIGSALAEAGVDVLAEQARGALALLTTRDSYLRGGAFEPASMVELLRRGVRDALARGFVGFRVTGEMTWALAGEAGSERLVEYEALLNEFFPGQPAMAICQYDRRRFPAALIRDVLRTHPIVVLGDMVCPNIYYEPPEVVLAERDAEEHRVAWMVEQLKRARAAELRLDQALDEHIALGHAAREAVRARDDFLSVAAHELKTPLTSLKGFAQVTLRRLDQAGDDRGHLRRALEVIDQQATKLSRLVTQLLDVSRIEEGRLRLASEESDVAALVGGVVARAQALTDRHRLVLEAPPTCRACLDPLRFEQVAANLVENAIKYSPEGGPVAVGLAVEPDGMLQLEVRDRGLGVPPELRGRLFERLFRAHSTQHSSGLGLGLYISRGIVRAHGGEITAHFPPEGGSHFVVRIPARPAL